ncbi:WD40 repeat-like protein [Sistotremastrum suecicum HHB10207 ss-3]|uniref:WD40 repeat-like protein n=1 Tax=Sistotremastrum suecicum HHB10207 ss-3 TaxID=1314776 RepID=A0A166ARL8_9AGAM|nr:WD40 repeat-like protein [Sistotremastrum suecicum HHB10207 ss-3]
MDVVGALAEINPYTKAVKELVVASCKMFQDQQHLDEDIRALLAVMKHVFELVSLSKDLSHDYQRKIASQLVQQTTECGYFIQAYGNNKQFLTRMFSNPSRSASDEVARFSANFSRLREAFQEQAVVQVELAVFRVASTVQDIAHNIDLLDMRYGKGASFVPEKGCLPGTRTRLLAEITRSLIRTTDPQSQGASLLWLKGASGSGKSTLAHTIAKMFHDGKRLGSSFIFDRSDENIRVPEALFCTISQDLAALIPEWKQALSNIIRDDRALRSTKSVRIQFEKLILEPAKHIEFFGPILIVIDALDECIGDFESRRELHVILSSRLHELPSSFHIFMTSRPDNEIEQAFHASPQVSCLEVGGVLADPTEDIVAFYKQRLVDDHPDLAARLDAIPDKHNWLRPLIEKSQGLFQWAITACRFILEPQLLEERVARFGVLQKQRISNVAKTVGSTYDPSKHNPSPLHELYTQILNAIFASADREHLLTIFPTLLGRVLAVYTPLPVDALDALRDLNEDHGLLKSVVELLGSLLTGVSAGSQDPVRVFHTSFRDFLVDKECSGVFYIDPFSQHVALASACLRVLNSELKFNIVDLPTSYASTNLLNAKELMRGRVSAQLLYASEFWSNHLAEATGEAGIMLIELVQEFLNTNFLFWLELLGLTQKIYWAGSAIRTMVKWASECQSETLVNFGTDAERFISNFAEVIGRNPAHLYISILPFAPESSLVSQQYLPLFTNTICARSGKQQVWSEIIRTFPKRKESGDQCIYSMTFSPDGTLLITAAEKSICMWDLESGQLFNTFSIDFRFPRVAVSPDGKLLAATKSWNSVVIRGLSLGDIIQDGTEVSNRPIICLQFSADSRILWIGSDEGYVCTWEMATNRVTDPMQLWDSVPQSQYWGCMKISRDTKYLAFAPSGHSISIFDRLADRMEWANRHEIDIFSDDDDEFNFSPDGRSLASGHRSGFVYVWDVESATRKDWESPSTKHESRVRRMSFSPNVADPVIVSSSDRSVRLWDGVSGSPVGKPVQGQNAILSVLFSPDGRFLATGAWDGTICLLDRQAVEHPIAKEQADKAFLTRIVLSPDEKCLFASSADCSIHRFALEDRQIRSTGSPMRGHTGLIVALAISPNGKLLASGSADNTICIWDIQAEESLGGRVVLHGHTAVVREMVFDHHGEHLVSCSDDSTIRVWNTVNCASVELRGHNFGVYSVQFYNNDGLIMSGSRDKTIRIWNAESGQSIGDPLTLHDTYVFRIALSSSEELVASSSIDGVICIWDLQSRGSARRTYLRHGTSLVRSLVFTSDELHLLSAAEDHTIRLWNLSAERPQQGGRPWEGHSGEVRDAFFLNNQSQIISSAHDGIIRIWDVDESSTNPNSPADLQTSFPRIDYNGWVHSDEEEPKLLFWLPPHYRSTFVWGRCRSLVNAEPLQLDFSRFVHGERWAECWTGPVSASSRPDASS